MCHAFLSNPRFYRLLFHMDQDLARIVRRLKLVVNCAKSRCTQLRFCEFLGYALDRRGRLVWTDKALHRFKERVREITRRNLGHRVQDDIDELRGHVTGWHNYYKLSCTYTVIERLAEWVRRRVRLYYWKQWKQPGTRRRNVISLGIDPAEVHRASRSRKGYWRMSQMSLVRHALDNRWLEEQGVPDMRAVWIKLHCGPESRV